MNETAKKIADIIDGDGAFIIGVLGEDGTTHAEMGGDAGEVALIALALLCGVADRLDGADKDKLKEIIAATFFDENSDMKFSVKEVNRNECTD